ncbi:hypothetical protein NMG60_11018509 [Bertholletia excelsa]
MAYSMVAPRTFSLKLGICCRGCERKLRRLLQKIPGVHSAAIDADQGKITISGTADPERVIGEIENKYNRKAVLGPKKAPMAVQEFDDHDLVAQIQQLSGASRGLNHVEVTYSKTVKVVFNGDKNKVENITVKDDRRRQRRGRAAYQRRSSRSGAEEDGYSRAPTPCHEHRGCKDCHHEPCNLCSHGCLLRQESCHGHGSGKTCHETSSNPCCPKHKRHGKCSNFPEPVVVGSNYFPSEPPEWGYDPSAPPWPETYGYPYTSPAENPSRCAVM